MMVRTTLTTIIDVNGMKTTVRSPTRRMSPGRLPNHETKP